MNKKEFDLRVFAIVSLLIGYGYILGRVVGAAKHEMLTTEPSQDHIDPEKDYQFL